MGKRTGLDYPELDNESIKVTGFLNLKSVKMETGTITVLIGEQAAGKSILAKLQYFFWKYQSDLFDAETISQKTIAGYSRDKVDEFFELFSVTNKNPEPFKIEYKNNDIEICLERTKTGHKPRITTSSFLEKLYTKVKKHRIKHLKSERDYYGASREMREKKYEEHEKMGRAYHKLRRELDKFNEAIPNVLYVPAARSFFSTIENNVFAFLAKGKESLDPLIVQFGEFYETAKSINQRPTVYGVEKSGRRGTQVIKDILKGDFLQENDEDIIRTAWGDVELRHASSGQQEALPLILSLLYFPSVSLRNNYHLRVNFPSVKKNKNRLIIIEEPESHLFPTAQKRILEEIVKVSKGTSCSVLIATHSPYILSCLNKEIHQAKKDKKEINVRAYYARKQKLDDIYDTDDKLIDLSDFDATSMAISNELIEALDD